MTNALPKTADEMKDILDIEPVLMSQTAHWIRVGVVVAGIFLTLLLLYYLVRWILKRRRARLSELSPFERAVAELEALRKSRFYNEREWPPYYFRLTETFKHFISGHCHIDIVESTTSEIFRLKSEFRQIVDDTDWDHIKGFLLRSDEIKFAKVATTPTQAGEDFDFVSKLVRNVSPPKTPELGPSAK